MTLKHTITRAGVAALCAMSLSAVAGSAMAGSVTYPGELVGVAWAPLPEGVYAVNTSSFANDRAIGDKSSIYVDIPVIAWSTPWTFLGGRVEAYVAGPFVGVYAPSPPAAAAVYTNDFYNPFVAVGESWSLGNGFYFAGFVGSYLPMDNALGQYYWTPNLRFAFGYTADGWDLTAHTTVGFRTNDINTNPGIGTIAGTHGYDYINEDLTATKKLGKWELGPVAFGSWDIGSNTTTPGVARQGQFAVGGLVGYDFGGLYAQAYLTHDVWQTGYAASTYETNIFGRIIIPLWSPPPAPKVVSKY
jgi:hypothetical protein